MTNSVGNDSSQCKQSGFTLIELVIVIIILGILAVVAAPKFINLKSDAYASSMQGVAAAINSGKIMVYSACVISTSCDETKGIATGNGLGNSIIVQGQSITLAYGYPRHTSAGIARLINIADNNDGGEFNITTYDINDRPGLRIRPNADYATNKCEIRYSQPLAAGEQPLVEVNIDDC
ncbi:prepilin-type N-terminal cleavage/methylation domain-containing protein [Shewanella livingstonensis]|uniref:Prepilin-type N-terminal cleavage/methylation domain-containing protein n=1 Tax=Shewanella livingstonensis TaxID=150120 RepID=A0A3G8LZW0_9GAMM|nr:prepilin-type N-terminal cleavage/methylation domain-containing protein [Shewanella livingstonensis]AZG74987.1 prepilin-type N-terminal cleavage/methylation domain-containing protein [Shewanella livingstonensis]